MLSRVKYSGYEAYTMTDIEAWTLLNEFNNSGMNAMALYLTVASGYLIVAHLAESSHSSGDKLSGW